MKKIFILFSFILLYKFAISQTILPLNESNLDSLIQSKKEKVVLVNLWAEWCEPCKEEFPDLIKLYNTYKDKNFEVIFITIDSKSRLQNSTIPFLEENKVDFITYYNDFKVDENLINYFDKEWDGAIPSSFIFDKEGNIKAKFTGKKTYKDFENEITKLM